MPPPVGEALTSGGSDGKRFLTRTKGINQCDAPIAAGAGGWDDQR